MSSKNYNYESEIRDFEAYARRRNEQNKRYGQRKSRRSSLKLFTPLLVVGIAAFFAASDGKLSLHSSIPTKVKTETVRSSFPICGSGKRRSCIVDGDTLWFKGEKIRLAGIDAPELYSPKCTAESTLARSATHRLKNLLSSRSWEMERRGTDHYGRTLAYFRSNSQTAGELLVKAKLAKPYRGSKSNWCG